MVRLFSGAMVMCNCRMRSDAVSMVAWVPFRYGPVEAMGFVDTFSIAYSVLQHAPSFEEDRCRRGHASFIHRLTLTAASFFAPMWITFELWGLSRQNYGDHRDKQGVRGQNRGDYRE